MGKIKEEIGKEGKGTLKLTDFDILLFSSPEKFFSISLTSIKSMK
jgi:hypothetical protein